ncbi:dynamin family protein [Streptomyces sp. NPDC002668]|uniref:dynamin family protein n=1 Tax=Streptomyces sp. NPDC002668 TaxID=3154422 RepID=UPI003327C70D
MTSHWADLRRDKDIGRLGVMAGEVRSLVSEAEIELDPQSQVFDRDWITRVVDRVSATLSVMVIGQVSSGKSSLINSLLGRKLLITDSKPTDGVVAVLNPLDEGTPEEYAEQVWTDGTITRFESVGHAVDFLRQQKALSEQQVACREVRLYLREPLLRRLRLISTPGLADRLQAFEDVTLRYLREDESDLVLWTFYPESAGNAGEAGVFARALADRREAVLGVVTRSLEDRDDDPEYDPHHDPRLTGPGGVVDVLRENLGAHLTDIVLYDSHEARRLVARRQQEPALAADSAFQRELERCGYLPLHRALEALVGPFGERIERSRVRLLLLRCAGHAKGLADVLGTAKIEFRRRAAFSRAYLDEWARLERDVIEPARTQMRDEIRTVAAERAPELTSLYGRASADTVLEHFTLVRTLVGEAANWAGAGESAAERLDQLIRSAIARAEEESSFWERVNVRGVSVADENLRRLQQDLRDVGQLAAPADGGGGEGAAVPLGRPGADAQEAANAAAAIVGRAAAKAAAAAWGKLTAQEAAKETAKEAAKEVVKQASKESAKQTATAIVGTVLTVFFTALMAADFRKLVKDFGKDRDALAGKLRARYAAEEADFAGRIFDHLAAPAERRLEQALRGPRASLAHRAQEVALWEEKAARAQRVRDQLTALAHDFTERAGR